MNHPTVRRAFALPLLLLTALSAQDGVRLVAVPQSVRLPAAAGTNLLLEVEVAGAAAAPWLAGASTDVDRLPLTAVGERRFQANLADPRLAAMLPAGRDHGELFVYAKVRDRIVQSAAIAWTRAAAADGAVRCVVRRKGGTTTVLAAEQRAWLDARATERLELQGAGARQSSAVARFGGAELPLRRLADQDLWVLAIDEALQQRLDEAPSLELEARLAGASALFSFALMPPRLPLPDGVAKFVVPQRRSAFVPGSRDWLDVRIDDITMGHVLLEIVAADGSVVLARQLVQERDHFEFALGAERYVLVVEKLVNRLVGDDHAELQVRRAAGFEPDRIGLLLRAVEASDDTFLREGKEHAGPVAAQFLIARLAAHRGNGPTVDEFVDRIASRSSRTDAPYEVRTQDGRVVTMRDWLRRKLQEIEAQRKSAERAR